MLVRQPAPEVRILPDVMKLLTLILAAAAVAAAETPAELVYINGTVVTMDARASTAEAVAVAGGEIVAVGSRSEVEKRIAPSTIVVDLEGKTLLPGLYSAHDHFPNSGTTALFQVDLNSPPIGTMESIEDIVAALKRKADATPPGQWVVGRGYDDTLLREKRHPNRNDLDRVSTRHPVLVIHTSGHLSAANSVALEMAKVTRDTPQPKGGHIHKDPKTGEPTGVMEETSIVRRLAPALTAEQTLEATRWAGVDYASKGVTTAVVAGGSAASLRGFEEALARGVLPIRLTVMLNGSTPATARVSKDPDRIRPAAVKLFQDGSIQGYTGYLSAPYHRPPAGKADYRGYPTRSREELAEIVKKHHRAGLQIAIHGNGDAAIDDILYAFAEAQRDFPRADARHRIEHCQTAREDQLDRMKELGMTPSFFAGHVYYWGDRHRDIFLGPARGARISPLASAARRGMRFTVHDDTPVTPVNPLHSVWVAANRITRQGKTLGPDQRISVLQALRAVTSDAAWQNFEEKRKGSIEPGKLADFVVLDRNPLSVPPMEIRDIRVLETIVGGRTVHRRGLEDWWVEGAERVWMEDGRIHLKADRPKAPGGGVGTVWMRKQHPGDFEFEADAHVVSSTPGVNNINLFFGYSDPAGKPLEETRESRRTADYKFYHQLNGYIVTFLNDEAGKGKARVRIRRNPGFHLLAETFAYECRQGVTYRLRVVKRGGQIVFSVDGQELLRATDPEPLGGGHFGLRTYRTHLWWSNISLRGL